MRQSRRDSLKRAAFVLLAAAIGFGTGLLISVARRVALDQLVSGKLFTVSAALQLFSTLFIVAGAAAAIVWLLRACRRTGTDVHPDDPRP